MTVHQARNWWWFQTSHDSDETGPLAGLPYDGHLTLADGKGTWWEGYDPQTLYGPKHPIDALPDASYAKDFYDRTRDLVDQHDPDLLYFDNALLPLGWAGMSIGAYYYNQSLTQHGKVDCVVNIKNVDVPKLKSVVADIERGLSDQIMQYPWQSETCLGEWHYQRKLYDKDGEYGGYLPPQDVIHWMADTVSKNGTFVLNVPGKPDGTIDSKERLILEKIGVWMATSGEAIYATRPWTVYGEGPNTIKSGSFQGDSVKLLSAKDIRYTRNKAGTIIYAIALGWPDGEMVLNALGTDAATKPGRIDRVELLGTEKRPKWRQTASALQVTLPDYKPDIDYAAALKISHSFVIVLRGRNRWKMMNFLGKWILVAVVASAAVMTCGAAAQDASKLPYINPSLTAEARAADLVQRMTLEEKASQLVNHARAIPRLGVPAYDYWSEALHGVIADGTTEFPEPIGLAATFDAPSIHQMAEDIGIEGRIKHEEVMRAGHSSTMEGLDFWAPNINIFRDPRWGRGQETYGEDPFLTGRMGVAYVTGLQGDDPHYYRAISTPKHYAVHSGPEPTRHISDVDVSKHDMEDTYLPAFRAAVVDGHAGSVMCAYNAINGEPACTNQFLLQHTLRGAWQFQGYVVSDCGAVHDIFEGHHYRASQPEASAISLERGMDNECITYGEVTGDADYKPYIDAVHQGYLTQNTMDTALVRDFTARMKLGMFDPPSMVPYSKIDPAELDSAAHRAFALRMADEAMVLLKNDGVLPLKNVKRIAIVGPLAGQTDVLLGNYNGHPTHTVSLVEGMKAEFPNAQITYVPGTQFLSDDRNPVPASVLTTPNGKSGLKAEYGTGEFFGPNQTQITSRVESTVDLNADNLPVAARGKTPLNVHWSGFITPTETGDYLLGAKSEGGVRVAVDDHMVAMTYGGTNLGQVHLEKGKPAKLDVNFAYRSGNSPKLQLIWAPVNNAPDPAAVTAAKDADVVIAAVGITSHLEGEEMPVSYPGFEGGDRTNLQMPAPEEALVQAVAATGKPLVVVLMNGSALAVNWEKEHANAILESWYSGEEGGAAIAETLSGKNNPAGRLPVTFYKDVQQLPKFEDYSMKGRTYRYFTGQPLWPFGYGLSYTSFKYGKLVLPKSIAAGAPLNASVQVTNTGKLAGDEVVQLYLKFPDVPGAPIRALRGFQRVHLAPGASQTVKFQLERRALSMVTETGDTIVAKGKYAVSVGSGQPGTGAPSVGGEFKVNGQLTLPE